MSATKSPMKPNEALECARAVLKENIILPLVKNNKGGILEAHCVRDGQIEYRYHRTSDDYLANIGQTTGTVLRQGEIPDNLDIGLALWLFGPERVETPSVVYRALSQLVSIGGNILVASEAPWPGKILSLGEYAEYTPEETIGCLVRAGFESIGEVIGGPFFRLFSGKRSHSKIYLSLMEAQDLLTEGNWEEAQIVLEKVKDPLLSLEAVREYALLVAACHDLAGRSVECLEALSEALNLDSTCSRAMCGLGRMALLRGDLGSAEEFFSAALRHQPSLVAALHGKAVVMEAAGKMDEAFETMVAASDLRPGNHDLMSEAMRIGNEIGRGEEVSRFLQHRIGNPVVRPSVEDIMEGPRSSV